MKTYFSAMRFVFVLFFLGVYQTQASEYTYSASMSLAGWNYEAVNTAGALKPNKNNPDALLTVYWGSKGNWSAVGRQYQFPSKTVSGKSIVSSAQIKSWESYAVNMEVIDPVTWRYIAVAQREVRGTGKVDTILFPTFTIPSKPVYFRVANIGAAWGEGDRWAGLFISGMNFKATY